MTLNDFLKRVDIEKDGDKMLLHCEYFWDNGERKLGWDNVDIEIVGDEIRVLPDGGSPFSSDK